MPVKPRPLRSVRNQFEHPNDSLQWIMLLFSHMKCFLWNIKLILSDSVGCFEMFDHWGDVLICLLINTSAPSHWLKSGAWPVGPVLKFRDIPDCSMLQWIYILLEGFRCIPRLYTCAHESNTPNQHHRRGETTVNIRDSWRTERRWPKGQYIVMCLLCVVYLTLLCSLQLTGQFVQS